MIYNGLNYQSDIDFMIIGMIKDVVDEVYKQFIYFGELNFYRC